jgi:hypothetical protein
MLGICHRYEDFNQVDNFLSLILSESTHDTYLRLIARDISLSNQSKIHHMNKAIKLILLILFVKEGIRLNRR